MAEKRVCRFFQEGRCQRGKDCPFSHPGYSSDRPPPPPPPPPAPGSSTGGHIGQGPPSFGAGATGSACNTGPGHGQIGERLPPPGLSEPRPATVGGYVGHRPAPPPVPEHGTAGAAGPKGKGKGRVGSGPVGGHQDREKEQQEVNVTTLRKLLKDAHQGMPLQQLSQLLCQKRKVQSLSELGITSLRDHLSGMPSLFTLKEENGVLKVYQVKLQAVPELRIPRKDPEERQEKPIPHIPPLPPLQLLQPYTPAGPSMSSSGRSKQLCRSGCGQYGEAVQEGYCSRCFRLAQQEPEVDVAQADPGLQCRTAGCDLSGSRDREGLCSTHYRERQVQGSPVFGQSPAASGGSASTPWVTEPLPLYTFRGDTRVPSFEPVQPAVSVPPPICAPPPVSAQPPVVGNSRERQPNEGVAEWFRRIFRDYRIDPATLQNYIENAAANPSLTPFLIEELEAFPRSSGVEAGPTNNNVDNYYAPRPEESPAASRQCPKPGCDMYGTPERKGYCSGCYQEALKGGDQLPGEGTREWFLRRFEGRVPQTTLEDFARSAAAWPQNIPVLLQELEGFGEGATFEAPEETMECASCQGPVPIYEGHELATDLGGCGHWLCDECARHLVTSAIDSPGAEARCPMGGCRAEVPQVCLQYLCPQRFADIQNAQLRHELQRARSNGQGQAYVRCPRCSVAAFLHPEDAARPEGFRAMCDGDNCKHSFCSKCAAPRWHYIDCNGEDCRVLMRGKQAAWLQWQAQGQAEYLQRMAAVDAAYAQQLQRFEGDRRQQQQVYDAFMADEAAKAGWRHCPYCRTAWAGTDACPSVTCGVMAAEMGQMGGRMGRVGCGRQFNFQSQGLPYVPAAAPRPAERAPPVRAQQVVHTGVNCDKCQQEIQGLRFRCLHCSEYNLCLPCLAQHGPGHDAEQEWPGVDGEGGEPHIFDIIER